MNATGAPPFRAARPRPLPPGAGGLNALSLIHI